MAHLDRRGGSSADPTAAEPVSAMPEHDHADHEMPHEPGREPGPDPGPEPGREPGREPGSVVNWALYVGGRRAAVDSYPEAVIRARRGEGFVWVGLHEPQTEDIAGVQQDFGLHPLAVEDAVHAHQRPKLDRYDGMLFAVFKTVRYVPHEEITETSEIVDTGEVMLFVGTNFVVTVRHGSHGGLQAVRQRLDAEPQLLALGPSAVLYAVADNIIDGYLEVTNLIPDDIDDTEELVFSSRRGRDIERVYQVKREVLELRRAVTPLAIPLYTLAHDSIPLIPDDIRTYFRDVEDHLTRAREAITGYEELLNTILQASIAQLAIVENEDVRRLAAWAAIIAVPTAIAGIYGMNFEYMPELGQVWGYPAVLIVIATVCFYLYRRFKRSGWL
jgi:magnesium transporter